jgi:ferric-dicitrate binding protein FerR (iron transport regulator)
VIRFTCLNTTTGEQDTFDLPDGHRVEIIGMSKEQRAGQDFAVLIEAGTVTVRDGRDRVVFRKFPVA